MDEAGGNTLLYLVLVLGANPDFDGSAAVQELMYMRRGRPAS
ncbi:hypothetical protein [Methylocaldum sp. 14B]|jgi:hypothetical protein|nr:hypothetical protein [Methylocaldum sp. 14B]